MTTIDTQHISPTQLAKVLRRRHIRLIALGGAIGAGLFVGSGVVIGAAGPASVVSMLLAGILTALIMRMLSEMAVALPVVGSFYVYARQTLGQRAGFTTGWMYWYFFVVVVAVEAVAGGRILHAWMPAVPLWLLSLALMLMLTATNLVSARSYGEFEYWLSSIKIIAIVLFLSAGLLWITGRWPHSTPGLSNIYSHGGFAPMGWAAVLVAVVPCVAFYTGAEIVTIAAAESNQPEHAVARSMKSIVLRIIAFYVGSTFIVVAVRPWNAPGVDTSPYASALSALSIPAVGTVMNILILIAVLSCLNSAMYTSSRMLFALSQNGDAPSYFSLLSGQGVPRRAILLGTVVGYFSVSATYFWGDVVFSFLVNSYGAVALFVYLIIAIAQLKWRRDLGPDSQAKLKLKMWLFPWLSYLTIALMATVLIAMGVVESTRSQLLMSALTLTVILLAYHISSRSSKTKRLRPIDHSADDDPKLSTTTSTRVSAS